MAIVPFRRHSKTKKRLHRTHFHLDAPGMMVCPNCGEVKLSHTVCKKCGYYDGRLVREIKVKEDTAEEAEETKTEGKEKEKEKVKEKEKEKSAKKETVTAKKAEIKAEKEESK